MPQFPHRYALCAALGGGGGGKKGRPPPIPYVGGSSMVRGEWGTAPPNPKSRQPEMYTPGKIRGCWGFYWCELGGSWGGGTQKGLRGWLSHRLDSPPPHFSLLLQDTMVPGSPGWCLLVGLCALVPPATTQGGPEEDVTPSARMEELGYHLPQDGDPLQDPQRCGITFHTPSPCSPRGPPASTSRDELDHLKNLLQATKASLKDVETAATLEDNQTRYQDVITEALPAIRGANLEFQESLDNVRRELEAHVAEADHPQMAEKKEKWVPWDRDGPGEMLHGADAPNSMGGSHPQVSPRVPQPSWWLSGDTWGLDAQQTTAVDIHECVPALKPPQRGR